MEKTGRFGNEIVTVFTADRAPVWACRCEVASGHARSNCPTPFCLFTCVCEKLEETPAHQGTHVLAFVFVLAGFHCPLCSKFMASDEIEKHLLMCFSKTRLTYNSTILYYLYFTNEHVKMVCRVTHVCFRYTSYVTETWLTCGDPKYLPSRMLESINTLFN